MLTPVFRAPTRHRRAADVTALGLLVALGLCDPVGAQTSIVQGVITDAAGGRVSEASVTAYAEDGRRRIWTTADAQGAYRLTVPRPGRYLLLVEAPGFAPDGRSLLVVARADRTLDVVLRVDGVREHVIVTASRTPQLARGASKTVTVVTRDDIDTRSASWLADALRTVPGVRVRSRGGPGAFTTVALRGLRHQDTAVLVDGARFRDAGSTQGDATAFLQDMTVLNVDRIEVLRGSASSLYGSHAVGGVIDLIPSTGSERTAGRVDVEGGALGFARALATVSGRVARSPVRYGAGIGHIVVARGVDGDDEARNTNGQGRVSVTVGGHGALVGQVLAANAAVALNDSPYAVATAPRPTYPLRAVPLALDQQRMLEAGRPFDPREATFVPAPNDPDWRRTSRFVAGSLRFDGQPGDRVQYGVRYSRVETRRRFLDGPAGVRAEPDGTDLSEIRGAVDTWSGRLDLRATARQLVTVGYEFEQDRYQNDAVAPGPRTVVGVTQRSHAVFVQDQTAVGARLTVAVSGRLQTFRRSRPVFVPATSSPYDAVRASSPPAAYTGDLSAAYVVGRETTLRAHLGNGYRAPSAFERFGSSVFGSGRSFFGDPRLAPERSTAFDAGVDRRLLGNRARVSATYFSTRLSDIVLFDALAFDPDTDPFGRQGGYLSAGGGRARGAELDLSVSPARRLHVTVAYTFTSAESAAPNVTGTTRLLGVSDHVVALTATQGLSRGLDMTAAVYGHSDYLARVSGRAFRFDGAVRTTVGAGYAVRRAGRRPLRIHVTVDNVGDRQHVENGFRLPGRVVRAGASVQF